VELRESFLLLLVALQGLLQQGQLCGDALEAAHEGIRP
jgi:hypothetical protein